MGIGASASDQRGHPNQQPAPSSSPTRLSATAPYCDPTHSPNAPVQRRTAQRTARCNRLLARLSGLPRTLVRFDRLIDESRLVVGTAQDRVVQTDVLALVLVDAGVAQAGILVALELVDRVIHQGAV